MMKRSIVLVIALGMMLALTAAMVGCGGDDDADAEAPDITAPDQDTVRPPDIVAPGETPVAGFDRLTAIADEGITVEQYMGTASVEDAIERFSAWAEGEGWRMVEEGLFDMSVDPSLYPMESMTSGVLFNREDDAMVITAMDIGEGQVYLIIAYGPAERF